MPEPGSTLLLPGCGVDVVAQVTTRLSDPLPTLTLAGLSGASALLPGFTAGALLAFMSRDVVLGGLNSPVRGVRVQVP